VSPSTNIAAAFDASLSESSTGVVRVASGTAVDMIRDTPDNGERLREVRALRYEVCVYEQGRNPSGTDVDRREVSDVLDTVANIWCARDDGRLVGTISQAIIGSEFDFSAVHPALELEGFPRSPKHPLSYTGRAALAPTHRKSWVLPSLIRHCYVHGRALGGRFDFMMTNPGLVPLFERIGYLRYTTSVCHAPLEGGLLIPMVLPATDHGHLKRVRSACLSAVSRFAAEPEWGAWLRASHPIIDMYYGNEDRSPLRAAALAAWLRVPLDVAAELYASSFIHRFPAGTTLRVPGDRVTATFLAVNAPLRVVPMRADDTPMRAALDGVPAARTTLQCERDTVIVCVPDGAVVRAVRKSDVWAKHLEHMLWHADLPERLETWIFR
jgi:hypothetical protein